MDKFRRDENEVALRKLDVRELSREIVIAGVRYGGIPEDRHDRRRISKYAVELANDLLDAQEER